ncbi:MAG: hypothetical protein U9R38_03290 [Candidatus Margulisiibacteriota bacterium]|nr:hypothetical protein [Candidatus Margulisiibacteriota bacterium]
MKKFLGTIILVLFFVPVVNGDLPLPTRKIEVVPSRKIENIPDRKVFKDVRVKYPAKIMVGNSIVTPPYAAAWAYLGVGTEQRGNSTLNYDLNTGTASLRAQGDNVDPPSDLARFLVRTGDVNTSVSSKYKASIKYSVSALDQSVDVPSTLWVSLDIRRTSDNQSVLLHYPAIPEGKIIRYFDITKTGPDQKVVITNVALPAGQYYAVAGFDVRTCSSPNSWAELTGTILEVKLEPYEDVIVK